MKKLWPLVLMASFLGLSSCTNLRDLTPSEFRTQEFYRKTITLKTSIRRMEKVYPLYKLNYILDGAKFNITETGDKAIIWWQVGGFVKPATMALIDFEQPDLQKEEVIATVYAANGMWEDAPDRFIDMLNYKV